MNAPVVSPYSSGARGAAGNREARRVRILALVQAGSTYAGIAREEGLSRERVRQIVAQALGEGAGDSKLDHARAPIARLEPALRLAARGVADGNLSAIDRLLKVLERLDQYSAVAGSDSPYDENARERLLAKLDSMAQRIRSAREEKAAREAGDQASSGGDGETRAPESAPSGDCGP
jgi:hypothetical protein